MAEEIKKKSKKKTKKIKKDKKPVTADVTPTEKFKGEKPKGEKIKDEPIKEETVKVKKVKTPTLDDPKMEGIKDKKPKEEKPKVKKPKAETSDAGVKKAETSKVKKDKIKKPKPDTSKPDTSKSETPKPDKPKDKAPKTDKPKVEKAKAEASKPESSKPEKPKTKKVKKDTPKVEKVKAETPAPQTQAQETPKASPPKKAPARQRGLGRGLSALMSDVNMDALVSEDVLPTPPVDTVRDLDDHNDTLLIFDDIMENPDPLEDAGAKTYMPDLDTAKAQSASNPGGIYEPPLPAQVTVPGFSKAELDGMSAQAYMTAVLSNDAGLSDAEKEDARAIWTHKMEAEGHPNLGKQPRKQKPAAPAPDHNAKGGVTYVEMGQLEPNPDQPRRNFDSELITELADSIRQKGVLQPILVRPIPDTTYRNKPAYQVIAGERRWLAAQEAQLDTMPVFVREITDQEALEIGVIENVQRAELNPMEEAMAYKALVDQFSRTQEEVAQAVGKSRSYVANMMRLLTLPEPVQDHLAYGEITTGHARAIIAAPDPIEMAKAIVENDLSVRDAEDWARKLKSDQSSPVKVKTKAQKGADERRMEALLMDALGLVVDLRHKGISGGELRIKYKTSEQLDDVVARILGDNGQNL